jgi:hypothetical protein
VYGTCGAVEHATGKPAGDETRCLAVVWLSLGLPDHMVLVFPTSLNVGRPRLRSQIVLCMSLVLVVCSDCCCHIVQAEDGCITVVVGVPPPAIPPILGTIGYSDAGR